MNTKLIQTIIIKPLFTALSTIIFLGFSLIAFNYDGFIGNMGLVSVGIAFIIMIAPIIILIRTRNWGMLIVYLIMYFFLFIVFILFLLAFVVIGGVSGPTDMIGDKQFYNEHFERHTAIQNLKLKVYCKEDTIIGIGPGGGDYSAICIFQIDKNQVKKIENKFINDTGFIKLQGSELNNIIEQSKDLKCKRNISFFEYGYKSNIRSGVYDAYFIFSKDKKYLLFYIFYS